MRPIENTRQYSRRTWLQTLALTGGSVLATSCAIAKEDIWRVSKTNFWFVLVLVFVLILVTYVPVTGMGLVNLFYR